MFRKRRNTVKPGYKIWYLKENGKLLCNLDRLWFRFFVIYGLNQLDIFDGPTMLINSRNYDSGLDAFMRYVSGCLDVAIFLPAGHDFDDIRHSI